MNFRRFNIGPGAASMILIIVVLSMSTLGILSLMNARSDLHLGERSIEVAEQIYALNADAEASLAALDAVLSACAAEATDDIDYLSRVSQALPEGMELDDHSVSWVQPGENSRMLWCTAVIQPLGSAPRVIWGEHELYIDSE